MSLNTPIKISYKDQIRKLKKIPHTIEDLRQEIIKLYGHSNFRFRYRDDENDMITISCDQEFQDAYNTATKLKLPSFKVILDEEIPPQEIVEEIPLEIEKPGFDWVFDDKWSGYVKDMVKTELEKTMGYKTNEGTVWENYSCKGCGKSPIIGARYHCTVCSDLDYCGLCEDTLKHPHPFLKLKSLENPVSFIKAQLPPPIQTPSPPAQTPAPARKWCCPIKSLEETSRKWCNSKPSENSRKCCFVKNTWKNIKKFVTCKKPKMQFISHANMKECETFEPGSTVFKIWRVKNDGCFAWPEGCMLTHTKGELGGERTAVVSAKPGEEIEIGAPIKIPEKEGRYNGIWRLSNPLGKKFGDKLHVILQALKKEMEDLEEKVAIICSLGFTQEEAREALEQSENELELAIAKLKSSRE